MVAGMSISMELADVVQALFYVVECGHGRAPWGGQENYGKEAAESKIAERKCGGSTERKCEGRESAAFIMPHALWHCCHMDRHRPKNLPWRSLKPIFDVSSAYWSTFLRAARRLYFCELRSILKDIARYASNRKDTLSVCPIRQEL